MTFNVDDFLDEFKTRTAEARVCTRTDLLDAYTTVLRDHPTDSLGGKHPELVQLEDEIESCERVFHFQSISRREWLGLMANHPPTKAEQRQGLDHNPETFPQAAIAACSTDPKISLEQAEKLADRLPVGEFSKLWDAVLTCNLRSPLAPKAVLASVAALRNGDYSTTPAPEASPGDGSLADNEGQ